ncbi:DUF1833 family protein [Jiella pacifica]|uniref:DUF1833 domain-containing protein n=1 Tax=Jiella pacifica TaxID=2696469 RepID=A0A6N9SYH8_9HYPH|nr:DUF1833 family protein [Jiella pacifica]NDW04077.1 DUF1833 domain-containing protein [Jiella pacifica]
MFDDETGEVVVLLLAFDHPDLDEPMLISSDNADLVDFEEQLRGTVSRGATYHFMPMEIALPEEGEDAQPTLRLTVYDVGQELEPLLQKSVTPATVTAEIVLASAPDDPEVQFADFELTQAAIEAGNAVLDLTVDTLASEPFPADTFTPGRFGGLWTTF